MSGADDHVGHAPGTGSGGTPALAAAATASEGSSEPRFPGAAPAPTPGPLKILAAVAPPDETKTPNPPLGNQAEKGPSLGPGSVLACGPDVTGRTPIDV